MSEEGRLGGSHSLRQLLSEETLHSWFSYSGHTVRFPKHSCPRYVSGSAEADKRDGFQFCRSSPRYPKNRAIFLFPMEIS